MILLALDLPVVALAVILYAAGNGIYLIAWWTVLLALFGPKRYALILRRLARPGLIAQAIAPLLRAFVPGYGGTGATFALLVGMATLNVLLVEALWRVK